MALGRPPRLAINDLLTDGVRLVEMLGIDNGGRYILGDCGRDGSLICVEPKEIGHRWVSPREWSRRRDEESQG